MRNVSHLSLDVIHFPFDLLVKILCALGWLLLQPYCIYGLIHEAVAQSPVCRHTCMIARMDTHSTSTAFTVRARWALCSDASQVIAVSVSTEGGDFWWCESFLFFSCSLARNADGNSMLGVPLSCWAFWLKFQMCAPQRWLSSYGCRRWEERDSWGKALTNKLLVINTYNRLCILLWLHRN